MESFLFRELLGSSPDHVDVSEAELADECFNKRYFFCARIYKRRPPSRPHNLQRNRWEAGAGTDIDESAKPRSGSPGFTGFGELPGDEAVGEEFDGRARGLGAPRQPYASVPYAEEFVMKTERVEMMRRHVDVQARRFLEEGATERFEVFLHASAIVAQPRAFLNRRAGRYGDQR